ncbi:MAG: amidohydrolase [Bacillota bacterium]
MEKILIKDCFLVPMVKPLGGAGDNYYNGEIAIENGLIISIGPPGTVDPQWQADRTIDGQGNMVAMPGLINCHTHAAMTLLRSYADDMPLMRWLSEKIWPMEANLTAEDIYWGTMLCSLEMIKSGTTTFADMYFFMEETARAVQDSGVRACLSRGLIGVQENAQQALKEGVALVKQWQGAAGGRISTMLGPHAPYTCPPAYLEQVIAEASGLGVGIHIHVAETRDEIDQIREKYGKTPVQFLEGLGMFQCHVLAAHCVHVDEEDIGILAARAVGVAHNPESNMKLASGISPVPRMLAAGVNVGLGTDGAASNNNLDLLEEMRTAAFLHKLSASDPTVLPAYQTLQMATVMGARVLGLEGVIGQLQVGSAADLILIDFDQPHLYPRHDLIAHLVYSAKAGDVDTVIIDGRLVLQAREIKGIDEKQVYREVEQRARRLAGR